MSELRFSCTTVSEVTGMSKSRLMNGASRLGIRTNGRGYSAEQIKAIQHLLGTVQPRANHGTAEQLKSALNIH